DQEREQRSQDRKSDVARDSPTVILRKAHDGIVENPKDKAHRSAASRRPGCEKIADGSPAAGVLSGRRKNAVGWAWVLNAVLYGSIKFSSSRARQMWAIKSGQSIFSPFWAHEFYIVPGFRAFTSALSAQGDPLPVVRADSYFGDGRARANFPIDTFFLPDNFDSLVGAFLKLDNDSRGRFLRSAAAIYMAGELWEISISSCLLACVQAIEILVDRPPPTLCLLCSKDEQPGPTQLFRKSVEKYYRTSYVEQAQMRKNLYRVRSDLAHGRYLFQFDEAPFAVNLGATIASDPELEMSRSALTLAKEGARNWLLS
ncbi:MAG: hypothetical protein WBD78_00365, partial [Methylocella sp.]